MSVTAYGTPEIDSCLRTWFGLGHSVVARSRMMFDSFQQVHRLVSFDGPASCLSLVTRRSAPSPPLIKLNVDAGMIGTNLVGRILMN